jgi:hypothetical protein
LRFLIKPGKSKEIWYYDYTGNCPVTNYEKFHDEISEFSSLTIYKGQTEVQENFLEVTKWHYSKESHCQATYTLTIS